MKYICCFKWLNRHQKRYEALTLLLWQFWSVKRGPRDQSFILQPQYQFGGTFSQNVPAPVVFQIRCLQRAVGAWNEPRLGLNLSYIHLYSINANCHEKNLWIWAHLLNLEPGATVSESSRKQEVSKSKQATAVILMCQMHIWYTFDIVWCSAHFQIGRYKLWT